MTSHRGAFALAAVAASGLVLAACGGGGGSGSGSGSEDSKSADQVVKDAQQALRGASSYHLAGSIVQNGSTMTMDVKVQGKDTAAGRLDEGGGLAFDFIETGGKLYIRGNSFIAHFAGAAAASAIGDRWIAAGADDPHFQDAATAIGGFTDPSGLADSLGSQSGGSFSKNGTTTVNGQTAVVIKSKDGTLDVADSSPAYPLHLEGGSKGHIDITEYGANFDISAPSDAIDLNGQPAGGSSGGGSSDTGSSSSDNGSSSTDTSSDSSSS